MLVRIDGDKIKDWETFHTQFKEVFGFPDYYGRNMDAWIDCISDEALSVDRPNILTLLVDHAPSLKARCPEQFEALVECTAFVNWRMAEAGEQGILVLAFNV